jgi:hypothetical protein
VIGDLRDEGDRVEEGEAPTPVLDDGRGAGGQLAEALVGVRGARDAVVVSCAAAIVVGDDLALEGGERGVRLGDALAQAARGRGNALVAGRPQLASWRRRRSCTE